MLGYLFFIGRSERLTNSRGGRARLCHMQVDLPLSNLEPYQCLCMRCLPLNSPLTFAIQ